MNDLLKSINLRLNNPFILSFVISWIFWNWPIVVGLLWYNAKTLQLYGYSNYKALIMENADVLKNYIYPLCFAIAYPCFKLGFSALQTTVNAIDERTTKQLSGKGYIPTQKFLDLRDQYETNIQKLSDVITRESSEVNENMTLKTEIVDLEARLNTLRNELQSKNDEITSLNLASSRRANGQWDDLPEINNSFSCTIWLQLRQFEGSVSSTAIEKEISIVLKNYHLTNVSCSVLDNNTAVINLTINNIFESVLFLTLNEAVLKHPLIKGITNFSYIDISNQPVQ